MRPAGPSPLYETLHLPREQASVHNDLGTLHQLAGRWDQAAQSFARALKLYESLNLLEGQARSLEGLSTSRLALHQPELSVELFIRSIELYRKQGLDQNAARTALRRADVLHRNGTPATEVLAMALPAALYLDAVRFQFRTAAERIAWSTTAADAMNLVLDLAAETSDPDLVAELIEARINATTHSTEDEIGSMDAFERAVSTAAWGIELTEAAANSTPRPFTSSTEEDSEDGESSTAAGTSMLLANSVLRATPPPPLLIPTNGIPRTALHWWDTTGYPDIPRPKQPIRTW